MYEIEAVTEDSGRALANEINAVFKYTSAKTGQGVQVKTLKKKYIQEIFKSAALKYIDPNNEMRVLGKVENPNVVKPRRDTCALRPQKDKELNSKGKGRCFV